MRPRTSGSQYGEPSPVSAGTNTTPSVDSTEVASASVSPASAIRPSPSRSHCSAAPATSTAPSSANCGASPGATAAAVRRSPCGGGRFVARVHEHEAARPVRRLRVARRETALAEERRLLVSGEPGDRHARTEEPGLADDAARRDDPRQQARSTPKSARSSSSQSSVSSEQHRPRGVRHVGDVRGAVRQLPDEPRVDGSERELSATARRAREDPLELRRGEVRIRHEPGALPDQIARQLAAALGSSPVLPHDRVATGSPVRALQTIVVSRWFVIPIAVSSEGRSAPRERVAAAARTLSQISSGSCSTQPGRGSAAELR